MMIVMQIYLLKGLHQSPHKNKTTQIMELKKYYLKIVLHLLIKY